LAPNLGANDLGTKDLVKIWCQYILADLRSCRRQRIFVRRFICSRLPNLVDAGLVRPV
jgi:hypothetical protein